MAIGIVGAPLNLIQMILSQPPESIDFDEVFSQMAATGQSVFLPSGIYEEIPAPMSTQYEGLFFPPGAGPDPFAAIREQIFTAMEAHGIKMIVPASLLYPTGVIPTVNDPLVALLDAVGERDLLAAFYTYDEPVLSKVPVDILAAFYQHVKSFRPELNVLMVNAGVQAGGNVEANLDAVKVAADHADMLGWSIYGTDLPGAGLLSPYSGNAVVDRVTAVGDYMRWVEETLPDKLRLGILQGLGIADLFSDEAVAQFPPELVAAAQAPSVYVMSELARATEGAELRVWFGTSYLEDSNGRAWLDILDVSESIATGIINGLDDRDRSADVLPELAKSGAGTGITLEFDLDDDREHDEVLENPVYSVDDARFGVRKDGTVYLKTGGTVDYELQPVVSLIGAARFSDGRIATKTFTLTVLDELEQTKGTDAGEELVGTLGQDQILGLGGDDLLWGLAGADWMNGGSGNDSLLGGAGDDRLIGDSGADYFGFFENDGADRVIDFTLGVDKIVLIGTAAPALRPSGSFALVEFGDTEILLQGVSQSSLSLGDFILVESL